MQIRCFAARSSRQNMGWRIGVIPESILAQTAFVGTHPAKPAGAI
jgi:hypothetical protein